MSKKKLRRLKETQLELQNQLLEKQLRPPPEGWFDRYVNEPLKRYSAVILMVLSVIGGIWGVYLPLKQFLHEQRMSTQYQLNGEIIALIQQLDSAKKSEKTIAILTYYEKDAVPLLIYELGRKVNTERQPIVTALKTIVVLSKEHDTGFMGRIFGEKDTRSMVIEQLIHQTRDHFRRYYSKPVEPNDNKLDGMLNYIFCLGELGKGRKDVRLLLEREIGGTLERHVELSETSADLELQISVDEGCSIQDEINDAVNKI
jgi:hypothetical protein